MRVYRVKRPTVGTPYGDDRGPKKRKFRQSRDPKNYSVEPRGQFNVRKLSTRGPACALPAFDVTGPMAATRRSASRMFCVKPATWTGLVEPVLRD